MMVSFPIIQDLDHKLTRTLLWFGYRVNIPQKLPVYKCDPHYEVLKG
jgi:hypothetical protein